MRELIACLIDLMITALRRLQFNYRRWPTGGATWEMVPV